MTIRVELSEEEALVLFEWLSHQADAANLAFQDQAEERVLWDLLAQLERVLDAPLLPDYQARLAGARSAIRDQAD
jgi:hypothetical protein